MQVRVLQESFYFLVLINKDLCNVASLAAATATSMAVMDIRGFDLGSNWKQRAFAEARAAIAQLGERQTEDLKVPGRSRVSAFSQTRVLCRIRSSAVPVKPFLPHGMLHVLMASLGLDTPEA